MISAVNDILNGHRHVEVQVIGCGNDEAFVEIYQPEQDKQPRTAICHYMIKFSNCERLVKGKRSYKKIKKWKKGKIKIHTMFHGYLGGNIPPTDNGKCGAT